MSNAAIFARREKTEVKGPYDIDIAGGDFLMMGLCTIVYMSIVFIIEAF